MTTAGVIIDLAAGHAVVGDRILDVSPAGAGFAVGAMVVRPLSFGERLRVVASVTDPAALGAAVLAAARVSGEPPADVSRTAVEAVALHLAGARLDPSPMAFADALAAVTRTYGWPAADVAQAHADLIDRLAREVSHPEDGWTHIVLASATNDAIPDAAAVRDRLAADLLRRGGAGASTTGVSEVGQGTAGTRERTGTSAVAVSAVGAGAGSSAGFLADADEGSAMGLGASGRAPAAEVSGRGTQDHVAPVAGTSVRITGGATASPIAAPTAGATGHAYAAASHAAGSPAASPLAAGSLVIGVAEHSAAIPAVTAADSAATAAIPAVTAADSAATAAIPAGTAADSAGTAAIPAATVVAAAVGVHPAAAGSTTSTPSFVQPATGAAAFTTGSAAPAAVGSTARSSVVSLAANPASGTAWPSTGRLWPPAIASDSSPGPAISAASVGLAPETAPAAGESIVDLADHLAALLDDEADLRGVMR